eukprot:gene1600-125_t
MWIANKVERMWMAREEDGEYGYSGEDIDREWGG